MIEVKIKLESGAKMPVKKSATAACYDCCARLKKNEVIPVFGTVIIPLGFKMELPEKSWAEIRPRSGLTAKENVVVMVGTIDSDYRGEVGAIVTNLSPNPYTVKDGDRIAQMLIYKLDDSVMVESATLSVTDRGENGFGSTGKN